MRTMLTFVLAWTITIAASANNWAVAQSVGGEDDKTQVVESQLSDKPRALISFSLWVLTLSEPEEIPADELSANLSEELGDSPKDFRSAREVREYIGRLKVAGALRNAREFRLAALNQQPAKFQSGGRLP
ncbi:MAG TPA: hypothetical protein VHK01_15390, partial [Lacipirellulaceae bacterium]|nr:hypothetical protein [Lacipirellulaceae bacterium]